MKKRIQKLGKPVQVDVDIEEWEKQAHEYSDPWDVRRTDGGKIRKRETE